MAKLLGAATYKKFSASLHTADDQLRFSKNKVANVRYVSDDVSVKSSMPPAPAVLDKFEPYSAEKIEKNCSDTPI